jgi:UDP-glucose 4-epimerase
MKLLILGGTGFIGRYLTHASIKKGWFVVATGLKKDKPFFLDPRAKYMQVNLSRAIPDYLIKEKFDYIVNLSGYIKHGFLTEGCQSIFQDHFYNLQRFIHVLNRDNLKAFIQVGSSDEYGNAQAPQIESSRESPISIYSLAKLSSTHLMNILFQVENFPSIVLRPFLVYGPGQDQKRYLPYIINQSIRDQTFAVSSGIQLRDFCYVEDIADGIIKLLEQKKSIGRVINIGSGKPIALREVTELVVRKIGSGDPIYGGAEMRQGENSALYPDLTLIRELISWDNLVEIEDGIERTIDWYKACH